MPTPCTQPLPHVFPSPVPTQIGFPVESVGSTVIEPIELISNDPLRYCHFVFPASAFFVRQTPPPAGPIHIRQSPAWQLGSIASALIRLPARYLFGT